MVTKNYYECIPAQGAIFGNAETLKESLMKAVGPGMIGSIEELKWMCPVRLIHRCLIDNKVVMVHENRQMGFDEVSALLEQYDPSFMKFLKGDV